MNNNNNNNDLTVFAETNFRNQRTKFGIKRDDRRRHMYVIGKTGMGKTVLLENMAISDIEAGHGVAIVDPHGEFAERVLDFVPSRRINDVIYFNPADMDNPIAFNVVEQVSSEDRHLVASGLVGVFKKIWAESWGPRLEYVLRNSILALLEYPGSTLLGIMRILVDKEYRKKVVAKVTDPVVKSFWNDEFSKYPDRFMAEAVNPIQNKVGQFLSSALIRNIVGQVKTTFNIREAMDSQKILILNLSKGAIGEDASSLLGAMMVTKIQLAAMSRVDLPEEQRKDFYLYVDEFQNFATDSFKNILSEARKYRLNLIIAHQYIAQVPEEVRDAVFGNVGTIITFRVGAQDAEFLEQEFAPVFEINDIVNLPKYNIYLKLMINGVTSDAFSASTLPPSPKLEVINTKKIIRISQERYAKPRQEVEDKIKRWSEKEDEDGGNAKEVGKEDENSLYKNSAVCWNCGKETKVSFEPDNVRPIFCKDCLKKVRKGEIKAPKKPLKGNPPPAEKNLTEIHLQEVLEKEPVPFHRRREEQTEAPKNISSKIDNNNQSQSLRPGEVVKF